MKILISTEHKIEAKERETERGETESGEDSGGVRSRREGTAKLLNTDGHEAITASDGLLCGVRLPLLLLLLLSQTPAR